jgi:hypothetical protein
MTIICGVERSSASHFTQVILNVPQPYGLPMLLKISNDTLIMTNFSSKGEVNDALQSGGGRPVEGVGGSLFGITFHTGLAL